MTSTSAGGAEGRDQRVVPFWVRRVGIFSWFFLGFVGAVGVTSVLFALTSSITIPVVLAICMAVVCSPIVTWLADRGLNRSFGALVVLLGLVAIVVLVVWITSAALIDEADELSENLGKAVDDIKAWLADTPLSGDLADQVSDTTTSAGPAVAGGLAGGAISVINSITGLVTGLVLGMIVLYYLLKDGFSPGSSDSDSATSTTLMWRRISADAVRDLRGYFRGQTGIALMNGVVVGLAALVLGVPAAAAIGVVNFFGAYVPYLGAFIGGAFAVLMALGEGGLTLALIMLGVTIAVNLLLENLLQPVLLGSSLNVAPLPILLATTLGGMVAGMVGLVLAAPLLAIALDARRELRSSGFFDDPESPATD